MGLYLCWERAEPAAVPHAKLIAVYPEHADAVAICEARARELSGGSGKVTQSLLDDSWSIEDKKGRKFVVGIEGSNWGPVPSF